jgi:NAD+ diphosphatase
MSKPPLFLDRAGSLRTNADWLRAKRTDAAVRLVPVWRGQSLLVIDGATGRGAFPRAGEASALARASEDWALLGTIGGEAYFALDISHIDDPLATLAIDDLGAFADLRTSLPLLPAADIELLAYARGLLYWHESHRFCSRCGTPTESRDSGHLRLCPNPACATRHFPRTDPVVIMLVISGDPPNDHCLLGRQASWAKGRVSALAGFVEPGETLEDAVAREVMEEAGVPVQSATYFASQAWPFPASLMVGFIARADGLPPPHVDGNELEHAGWYTRAEVAKMAKDDTRLPGRVAIARWMIDAWLTRGSV